jgi:menaquinone-specific isochorismate synthase
VLTRYSGITWLTVNAYIEHHQHLELRQKLDYIARLIETTDHQILRNASQQKSAHRRPTHISYPLSEEAWHTQITSATRRMEAGELEKVVLSRTCDITFDTPIEPLDALANLETRYASAYRFLIEPELGSAFFGATPELLIELNGRDFKTAGLAGSIKRGATPKDDDQLAAQLWSNPKERHEHGLVVDSLRDLLEPGSRELIIPEVPGLLKLSNIQHLYTPIYGELNADISVLPMVESLHPTPALGGYPRNVAVETIINTEIISRGWYASPVGWVDARGDGTFAVAIRSAVSSGNQARLYAGAGIVSESIPEREWDETRLKFRPMLEALNAEIQ